VLRVLVYHRVAVPGEVTDTDPGLISATPEVFRSQMLHLRSRYRPVSLSAVAKAFLEGEALPRRAVHVTVDDAYRDFGEVTWPILRNLGIPVTLFVPTAYPDHPYPSFWWDRLHWTRERSTTEAWKRALGSALEALQAHDLGDGMEGGDLRALLRRIPHDDAEHIVDLACKEALPSSVAPPPRSPVLDWDELRALQQEGVTLGAHTRHHVALAHVGEDRTRAEIRQSLQDLRREGGEEPLALAYPYGIYNHAVVRIAREEGCALGFTTEDGLSRPGDTDPLRIPRTNVTRRTTPPVFRVRMLPWFSRIDQWRHGHHAVRVG